MFDEKLSEDLCASIYRWPQVTLTPLQNPKACEQFVDILVDVLTKLLVNNNKVVLSSFLPSIITDQGRLPWVFDRCRTKSA